MIASLPMYDRAETSATNDRLWSLVRDGLRARGIDAPDARTRPTDLHAHWRDPALVLSQTCGMPFRMGLHAHVQLVATPAGTVPGLPPGTYQSVIVVRSDDPRDRLADFEGARFAYNGPDSQSGWAAMAATAATEGVTFGEYLVSGAHRASAEMVVDGAADVAALDVLGWQMMRRWDGFAARLRVLQRTSPTPALPYICSRDRDPQPIRDALGRAIAALEPVERELLGLSGIVHIPAADYLAVPTPEPPPR